MIISVGYRVKSNNGIVFRRWANKIIKDYLLKGYVINQKRLEYLEKTVKLIDIASRIDDELIGDTAMNIIKVINDYSKALNLLDNFDYNKVVRPKTTSTSEVKITYGECIEVIKELSFNNSSGLFALERNRGLEQIINNIYQTFDNKDLYPSLEEKASNLLYIDNKQVIDNNTLACMTILISQFDPKEKEIIIDLVMNFLSDK